MTVPMPAAVRESLMMMLGREVRVDDAGAVPPAGAVPVAVGPYVDSTDTLIGCCWVDLPLGAAMGAAMSMAPTDATEQCLTTGVLPAEYQDNLQEVLRIASSLLAGDESNPVRLRSLELLETGLADDTLGLLADPRAGGFFTVEVEDYGAGLLSFTLA
ncbi:MAG: hypothetical protein QOC80_1591 [Frankiaceae bacterium]|nr:hypothetical protein [Frankiaceae bacterium]